MTETCDLHSAYRLIDDVCEEATDWLLQAGALLQVMDRIR